MVFKTGQNEIRLLDLFLLPFLDKDVLSDPVLNLANL